MTKQEFERILMDVFETETTNCIHLEKEGTDLPVFGAPIVGYASAGDSLFTEMYKKPEVIGSFYMTPQEWLPGAKTVISYFFPFSEEVRSRERAARKDGGFCEAWTKTLAVGDNIVKAMSSRVEEKLRALGVTAVAPSPDPRMSAHPEPILEGGEPSFHYVSTWSERHAAYAAGLGTFGIHKNLITEKGTCGKFGSIITTEALEQDRRPYTGVYDYCTGCGACMRKCPVAAITKEFGRNSKKCSDRAAFMNETHQPSGCGQCMIGVPCEFRNPSHSAR